MEWLVLFLLVPIIVASVVLLIGFAGCTFSTTLPPGAPTIVSAIPLDPNTVELMWTDPSIAAPRAFEIERTKGTESPSPLISVAPSGEPFRFVDASLAGGSQYTYRVRTIFLADGDKTDWSQPAVVETFSRVFTSALEQGGTNRSVAGQCIVQRISPGTLSRGGNLIGVTVRGASNANLALSRVTISSPAPAGDDFDSAATPVDLGTGMLSIDAGLSLPLQPTEFPVDVDEALLIAFDVDSPGNARSLGGVPHTAYVKVPPAGGKVTEAGTQNRAGFSQRNNELWFVDAIDIATKWPPIP